MQTDTEPYQDRASEKLRWRYVFTRMVPTAVIVFFILFTFYPRFGSPIANLRSLGGSTGHLTAQQKLQQAAELKTGLQQLQVSGELGSYLQASGGGTSHQTLSWDEQTRVLTISDGNSVNLGSLAAAPQTGSQTLSKAGNSLVLSGSPTTVDLASYLDNTDAQTLNLSGTTLTISGGNSLNLAPINTDAQTLSLSGADLTVSGGNTINLASINTDVLATLSCAVGQVAQWNGTAWVCASPAAVSDAQTLSLSGNNLSILNGNSVSLAGYLDNTDNQALSLGGNTLSLVNGGSVNLGAFLDNTDVLAGLGCSAGQIPKWNGSAWACAADVDTVLNEAQVDSYVANNGYLTSEVDGSTSNELQTLTWNNGTRILTISSGNTVDLTSLLDNTDAQAISKTGNTLSISGNASTVDLASYLDNTDAQTLNLVGTTLTVSGGNSIDLAPINTDNQNLSLAGTTLNISGGTGVNLASINTDVLAGLSCSTSQIAKWNGSAWACAADVDTVLDEAQVDTYVANNGYLTSEVDGSVTNEIQSLSLAANVLSISGSNNVNLSGYLDNTDAQTLSYNSGTQVLSITGGNTADLSNLLDNTDSQAISKTGNTLSITGNASTVDLSSYLDDTDTLASLSCANGQVAQWNGSAWVCASAAVDTDQQTLSLAANTLSISGGNSVSLAGYLDNTDAQAISVAGNVLSISGNASTVNLAPYLDNTDNQALSLGGNTLSLVNGGSVNLAAYLDNTDVLASLTCGSGQIAKWNGSAWACAADNDTIANETQVDAWVSNNGYLTSEVDGSTSNELQTLTWNSGTHILTISSGNTADLTSLMDNTDAQAISRTGNTVSITGNASTVDLSPYLDNTDAQAISKTGNTLSISGNASTVDLASYLDNTDAQTLNLVGTTLTVSGGNSIDLAPINTDTQTLSLAGTNLSVSGGNTVSLASINTDVLAGLSCSTNQIAKWNGSAWACAADVDTDTDTDQQTLSLAANNLSILNGNSVSLASYLDNTDALASLSCVDGKIVKRVTGSWACGDDIDTVLNEAQVDTYVSNNGYLTSEVDGSVTNEIQDLSLSGNTLALSGDGTSVDLSSYLDNTDDAQAISLATNVLSISGNASTVNLAPYLDNTDAQTLSFNSGTQVLSITGGNTADLSNLLDNTDAQAISKTGNTLSITGNASTVDLSSYLDNTDTLASLSCSNGQVAQWNGSAWVCANVGVDTDQQTLGLAGNTLSISNGNSVSLAGYLDNTDAQAISKTGNTLSITGNASTVDLSSYLDNTDVLASLSCSPNEIAKWNGSAWVCAADNDTVISEATVESYIFDGDNTGTLSSGTLALGSLSYTGALTDTNIADTLTIGATSTVSDSALSANVTKLGTTIESAEITDGTVAAADIAPDALDFTEFKDSMALDATTTVATGANNLNINLDSTGDFVVQDAGVAVLTVNDNGTLLFKNSADSASSFVVQDAASLPMFTVDTSANAVQIGTLVDDASDVLLVLDGVAGTTDPTGIAGGMYYNTDTKEFRCFENGGWRRCIGGTIAANTATSNAIAANTVDNLFTGGTGINYTIPANACGLGRTYKVTARGIYSNTTTASNLTINLKMGTTTVASTGAITMGTTARTNQPWRISVELVCRAAPSASSAVLAVGDLNRFLTATTSAPNALNAAGTTVNVATNANQTLQLSTQWSITKAGHTVTLQSFVVEAGN